MDDYITIEKKFVYLYCYVIITQLRTSQTINFKTF